MQPLARGQKGLILILVGITYGLLPYGHHTMGWSSPVVLSEIIGGIVILLIFGVITPMSPGQIVLAIPIGLQEMVLAVWLIVKGFDRSVLVRRSSLQP